MILLLVHAITPTSRALPSFNSCHEFLLEVLSKPLPLWSFTCGKKNWKSLSGLWEAVHFLLWLCLVKRAQPGLMSPTPDIAVVPLVGEARQLKEEAPHYETLGELRSVVITCSSLFFLINNGAVNLNPSKSGKQKHIHKLLGTQHMHSLQCHLCTFYR